MELASLKLVLISVPGHICTRDEHDQNRCVTIRTTILAIDLCPYRTLRTYVAPATTNSTVFALVEPESIAINIVAATTIVNRRPMGLVKQLQIITGASRSVAMKGVIKTRAVRVMDGFDITWTFGSLEISRWRL